MEALLLENWLRSPLIVLEVNFQFLFITAFMTLPWRVLSVASNPLLKESSNSVNSN